MICKNCGSNDVTISFESTGNKTKKKENSRIQKFGHDVGRKTAGLFTMGISNLFIPKKLEGQEKTNNKLSKFCLCQNCGYSWELKRLESDTKSYNKKFFWIIIIIVIIACVYASITDNEEDDSTKVIHTSSVTDISDFTYELNGNEITLNKYNGNEDYIIINDTYTINDIDYTVTNIDLAVFNGSSNVTTIYFPNTLTLVYDATLAYLNSEHVDVYFGGSEDEWNAIFTEYEISSVSEEWNNGNYEETGEALAMKINSAIGSEYNESIFTYHYNSSINDISL